MVFTKQLHPPLLLLLIAAGSLNLRPALGQQEQNFKFKNLTKRNDQDHTLDDDNSNYNSPHFEPLTQQVQSFDSTSLSDSSSGTTTPSSTSKHKGKRTLYACEKEQLQIECQLGESIQLIRANYGRFSIQICNEHGQLDWKVNCMSPDSYQRIANSLGCRARVGEFASTACKSIILLNRPIGLNSLNSLETLSCQAKQSCRLLASNSIFGDACPGTQKYLEVHYQCLPSGAVLAASNATSAAAQAPKATAAPPIGQLGQSNSAQQQQQQQLRQPIITARPNVIFPQQSDQSSPSTASSTATTNSERPAPGRGWQAQQQPPQLPSWIPELKYNLTAGRQGLLAPASTVVGQRAECPETIWRQVRWPATDAGHTARQPCPAHAQSGNPLEPLVASFACSAGGQWAQRAQAARCQSLWLRNLTSRFEQGDSPLSVLRELVAHTRPTSSLVFPHGLYSEPSDGLFGDDLIQLGRIVKRLAEETMGEYLHNIGEDKIRLVVAKEFVQSLVELINNLTHEQHLDAWLDLAAPSAGPPPAGAGERQRISAQLMGNLESALVLLAGLSTNQSLNSTGSEEFVKMGENVYAAIRPLTIAHESLIQNRSIEVRFPSEPSVLGTRWLEQRFSLNLQTSLQAIDSQVDVKSHLQAEGQAQQQQSLSPNTGTGPTTLKIVFVMIRGLGSQMESSQEPRMIVNSNLVSLSIVADSRSIKVDLSAPIELVFKHNFEQLTYQLQKNINSIQGGEQAVQSPWLAANEGAAKYSKPARCVYWDTNLGDWLSDGCLLLETNRTHSVCACNHLTTFALLSDLDTLDQRLHQQQADQQQQQQQTTTISSLLTSSQNSLYGGQNHLNYFNNRVQLDSVENELLLPPPNNQTLFYLAKLLDGHLFDSAPAHEQQQAFNVRLLVYISCLLSAILLAIYLAALAYNQAHARRLLGAIPSQPPPPLLVSNQHIVAGARLAETATYNSSTSGDSYSAALNHSMIFQQGPHSFKGARVFASNQPVVGQRGGSDKTSNANFKVPYYIYVQLFLLQLLLVFLVESQNYFAKNARHQQQHLGLSPLGQIYLDPSVLLNSLSLPTLGLSTWTVVILLYYLIGSLTVWLLWQLSRLNLRLALLSSASRTNQSSAPQIDAYNGNNIYGHSTLVSRNLYGNQSQMIIGAGNGTNNNGSGSSNNNNTATTISPTSSSYSSASVIPVGSGESRALGYALGQAPADLMKLSGSGPVAQDSKLAQLLIKLLNDKMIDLLVKHASPILFAGSIAYMTVARAQSVNMFTYTISYGSQLACWPLLLDLSLDLASFINYCVPMAALLLIALVTFYLSSISSKLDQTTQTTGRFVSREMLAAGRDFGSAPNQPAANPYGQQALKLQQQHQRTDQGDAYLAALNTGANKDTGSNYYGNHLAGGATSARLATAAAGGFTADQLKKAKFACFLLTSLVVFQSICWITLFAHIQRALHRPIEQTSSVCLYLFALANLGLVLILILVQRSSLRRACKLCGLRALMFWQSKDTLAADTMIGGRKGQKIKIKNSLHEHLRHSNSGSSGTENDERAFYQQASALQQQQQATLHQRQASGEMKMSPSDQSLFLISQQARQYGQSNYGLNGFQTQAHHMYQQLTTNSGQQQHIYDSTTAVNNSPEQVMQLMQRQHQLSGGNNNFNRSVNSLHHLQEQNFLHQHQRQPMTLKPMSSAFSNGKQAANQEANQCQLLVLDAQSALKQQQLACSQQQQMRHLQLPGEADGPLVALSSMSSQASSTSSSIQSSANNNNNQLMQQQQPTTFGPANNYMASEHQLFNEQTSGVRQAGNCSATSALNANNNQYCANNSNYNDALKAAMIQQQQQQHAASELHNFRRQNSKQSRNFQQQQHGNNNHPQQQLVNQRNPALMGSMIDHQIGQQHNHHRFSSGNCIMMNNQDLGSNQEDLNGNIYDVANYVINH